MIVSGSALIHSLNSEVVKQDLMKIAEKCSVVLACRVSPKQKQEIVSLVREQKPKVYFLITTN
jgi:phospholipid-transporting ATPase